MAWLVVGFRRWLARPARSPRSLRIALALMLSSLALVMMETPTPSGAGTSPSLSAALHPGPLAAAGGPPTTGSNAPAKAPEPPGAGSATTHFPTSPALVSEGMSLYQNGCSACHGTLLQGTSGVAPSLIGVGAGPVDFYLSTGRMPLQAPKDEPERTKPLYSPAQIDALIAYITTVGGGPPAPAADPNAGSLSRGFQAFTLHCAGCHQIGGRGGLTIGAYVPKLQDATALQIAEAVRMGPYLMPHFDAKEIDQQQLDSIARYVISTQHPDNVGGWGIGNIGPIPEGMVAWFIALLALVIVARLIGERTA
ncbi:MAG: c-type cytochrome [Solirubrobacteraceae bacterium]